MMKRLIIITCRVNTLQMLFKTISPGSLGGLQLMIKVLAVYTSYNLLHGPVLRRLWKQKQKQKMIVCVAGEAGSNSSVKQLVLFTGACVGDRIGLMQINSGKRLSSHYVYSNPHNNTPRQWVFFKGSAGLKWGRTTSTLSLHQVSHWPDLWPLRANTAYVHILSCAG